MVSPALRKSIADAKNKYGRSDGARIKPKEGRNFYRIIAPTPEQASWVGESGQFWADLGVHWIKAEPNSKPIAVVGSRDVCYQEPCPVGTAIDIAMGNAHDEQSKEIVKEWKVSKSVLFNAIDRTTDAKAQKVEILEVRPSVAQQIMDLLEQWLDSNQDITDPQTGVDIVITRSGKGLNTEYTVNTRPGSSEPVKDEALKSTLDLHDHIAKEFFRGEEQKALNAIAQITGLAMPQLAGTSAVSAPALSSSTPTAALTSVAASVPDANVETGPTEAQKAAIAAQEEAQRKALEAKALADKAAAEAAAAAAAAQAQVAAQTTARTADSELSADDIDDVLSQIDNI